jgi:hypothetical protein
MQVLRSSPAKEEKYIVNRNKQDKILTDRTKSAIHLIIIKIKMLSFTPSARTLIRSFPEAP